MNLTKRVLTIIIALIAAVMLTSCKNNDSDLFSYEFTPEPTVAAIETPAPDGSGEITVAMPSEVESSNPYLISSRDLVSLYNLIFEPLIRFDETGEPVPVLAQDWELDETGKKWTITIRDDVYWQQTGRKLDAYDVEFTLDLMQSLRKERSSEAQFCEGLGYIRYWTVEDEKTINFYSFEPFYGTIQALDFVVLPRDVGYSLTTEPLFPIGTGPYMITSWNPGDQAVLESNPDWWQRQPSIGKITAKPYDDNSLAISALQLNQLDVVQTDELALLATDQELDIFSYEYTTRYYEFLLPNFRTSFLVDKRVRQAIAYALDRDEIVSNVYINHAIPVDTPVPPTSFLFSGQLLKYDNDVEEAKNLLRLAGWKDLDDGDPWLDLSPEGFEIDFTLTLLTNNDNENPQRAEAANYIAKQLQEIGIKIEVKAVEWEEYQNMVAEGRYDLLLGGWYLNDIPDLRFMLKSDGSQNVSGYKDLDMDDLLYDIMQRNTRESLLSGFETLQQKIIDELPIISLYFRTHTLLTKRNITEVSQITEENAYSSVQYWKVK